MNGARTGLIENIIPRVFQFRLLVLQLDWPRRCGGATGGVRTGIAGLHPEASALQTVEAIDWVSVWSG